MEILTNGLDAARVSQGPYAASFTYVLRMLVGGVILKWSNPQHVHLRMMDPQSDPNEDYSSIGLEDRSLADTTVAALKNASSGIHGALGVQFRCQTFCTRHADQISLGSLTMTF
ncbi:hypothetical protein GQR58_024901 [Nymphon striatum]|nr:hypothetical protein GQR58_024901 [Nymphon striatum]